MPGRIISGAGALDAAGAALKEMGKKALVVTDKVMVQLGNCARLEAALAGQGIGLSLIHIYRGISEVSAKLEKQGIRVCVKESATVDEAEQLAAIDELEREGIDALALMPVDSDSIRIRLNRLVSERKIPLVTFNSDIVGIERMCFVGIDNWKSGRTAAGLMGLMMHGKGRVLGITGYFSNGAGSRRVDGFVEELKNSFPDIGLIGVQSSFDHTQEVEKIIVDAMNAYPDLGGIFVASGGQEGVKRAFERLVPETRPYVIIYDLSLIHI